MSKDPNQQMDGAKQSRKFYTYILIVFLIIAIGVYARFTELSWHFANVDDMGVAEIILKNRVSHQWGNFPISTFYTYAPFQFLITPLLISKNQTYRDLLFWVRLPSCVFGILGLVAMALFYRAFKEKYSGNMFVALSLLALSWENIIHAKQGHNYALGVLANLLLLFLLLYNLKQKKLNWKHLLISAIGLFILGSMHYQILTFVPAFFLALLIREAKNKNLNLKTLMGFFVSGATFGLLYFPIWYNFLRTYMDKNAGTPGSTFGPHGEFVFTLNSQWPLFQKIFYAVQFYVKNFFVVFQANTAFLPETHPAFIPVSVLLFILCLLGTASFFTTQNRYKKYIGLFLGIALGLWFILIFKHKLNFSPTRHSLILLPFMAIMTAEGWGMLCKIIKQPLIREKVDFYGAIGMAVVMAALFLSQYNVFLKERRDPFVEANILEKLKLYDVGTIFTAERSDGISLMKGIKEYREAAQTKDNPYKTVAWISRYPPRIGQARCEQLRLAYNLNAIKKFKETGEKAPLIERPCSEYRVVYSEKHDDGVQLDYSPKLKADIYSNSFYFYIVSVGS